MAVMGQLTTKYSEDLGTPEEASDTFEGIKGALCTPIPHERPQTATPAQTILAPPAEVHVETFTSPQQARDALGVVLKFIEQQPKDFLDFRETVHMGQLVEKLQLLVRHSS